MSIKVKIILSFVVLVIPIFFIGFFTIKDLERIQTTLKDSTIKSFSDINKISNLNSHAQFIRYFDEVLTQSARNYAFTGDTKWKERYNATVPELDKAIKDAKELGDNTDRQIFDSVDSANLALIKMEENSMRLVDLGKRSEAVTILESVDYAQQKTVYQNALVSYSGKQGKQYNDVFSTSSEEMLTSFGILERSLAVGKIWTMAGVSATGVLALILGVFTAIFVTKPLKQLTDLTNDVASGNLDTKIEIPSNDELGSLIKSFNVMIDQVKDSREHIEAKVKERTAELEKTNKQMVERELKMMELKKELQNAKV